MDLCRVDVGRLFLVGYLEKATDRDGPYEYLIVPDFQQAAWRATVLRESALCGTASVPKDLRV